jgi:Uma2 family endonuclease
LADNSVLSLDFVVGLASTSGVSPSDEGPRGLTALRQNMAAYQRNGAQLGWLLLPAEQAVEIWTAGDGEPQRIAHAEQLDGGDFFPGLQIPLSEIWQD